jgi:hypothetical protein
VSFYRDVLLCDGWHAKIKEMVITDIDLSQVRTIDTVSLKEIDGLTL